jgi:protein-S-isoprenylcysteine O-methyltransferase Ste14
MLVILYSIAFVGGFAPRSVDAGGMASGTAAAIVIDLVLLGIFAVQHSVMARPAFKRWWAQFVPPVVERSTFVLMSALALTLLFWQWRPIGGTLWTTGQPWAGLLTAVFWIGWATVLVSTFLINHFDLFGLAQVWSAWRGSKPGPMAFRTPFFYKVVRHPIYLGFLLAFWAAPVMSWGHALFAAAASGYILVGIWLEERDLVEVFGDAYRDYRRRVSMLIPLPPRRG